MKFTDLNFQPHSNYPDTGIAARHFFPNGHGVSVVQFTTPYGFGSYGAEEKLYELAVIKGVEENWEICYDTEVTNDVIGYLTEDQVSGVLMKVETLT